MALTDQQKKDAEIMASQGETPERIAASLGVDVKELGRKRGNGSKPQTQPTEERNELAQGVTEQQEPQA
jgi:hypothetical protein